MTEDEEYARAKAKLDHMHQHHGMMFVVCPKCAGDDPTCGACEGAGECFRLAAGGLNNCGAHDCPLPKSGGPS